MNDVTQDASPLHKDSIVFEKLDRFWSQQAHSYLLWFTPWTQVRQGDFDTANLRWFVDGTLNASFNCLDRHLPQRADQVALLWEGNAAHDVEAITYGVLHERVCRLSNVLLQEGVQPGDRVCIYLPMIPEAVVAMLACARVGAIHTVVFAGFSPDALRMRLQDANCCVLITADEGLRGEKNIPLKANVDQALMDAPSVRRVLVVQRTGASISWNQERDRWYHDAVNVASHVCPPVPMEANAPLFMLYTSGSTGKPKGVLHGTGGYLVYIAMTYHLLFKKEHELQGAETPLIHWCTADIGWITGHSYAVYAPLLHGVTTVLFEGIPMYPNPSRYWDIIDRHHVNVFYTAPTAIRALRREGDAFVTKTTRQSLTVLGSVGEAIQPDVWTWYQQVVGEGRCKMVNTWWQTETGGVLLSPRSGMPDVEPGSAGWPCPGIMPAIVNELGMEVEPGQKGKLVIKYPWPGLMQTVYGDHSRFVDTYLKPFPGCYLTGDGAYQTASGDYVITGREDDVMNVSGHRFGTEEFESVLLSYASVAEAAVVSAPDLITGEHLVVFAVLRAEVAESEALTTALIQHVRQKMGAFATPKRILWVEALPKTRSGKIMRRLLRRMVCGEHHELGDLSTLADASVMEDILTRWLSVIQSS